MTVEFAFATALIACLPLDFDYLEVDDVTEDGRFEVEIVYDGPRRLRVTVEEVK
jgi:hypothetical protein